MKKTILFLLVFITILFLYGCNKDTTTIKETSEEDLYIVENPESYDELVYNVKEIKAMIGPDSLNHEWLNEMGIYGGDLGMPVKVDDRILYLFGDSFSGENRTGLWFSNFGALSKDFNFDDGITFDSAISKNDTMVSPLVQGKHHDNNAEDKTKEVTKIPTGAIQIGDYVYMFYMSVRYWGGSTGWLVTFNQCVKSNKNDLVNWVDVEGLRWNDEEAYNFGQIYPYADPNSDYIYLYAIPGGRTGSCVLARTTRENFENREKIEYLVDKDTYVKGDSGLEMLKNNPYYIANGRIGEPCVSYNKYLNKYMMIFSSTRNNKSAVYMLLSDSPDKEFTGDHILFDNSKYTYYGGFTIDSMQKFDGKVIYLVSSRWSTYRTYNTLVVFK